jgi:hypothetical protein
MDRTEMNNQPLSHEDATALTSGALPPDRPNLVTLAAAIDDYRDAFTGPAPQPSPELVGWLTGTPVLPEHGTESTATAATPLAARTSPLQRRIRAAARALAALGVTAKIALGGTAAVAAVAAAGAVGALPEGPQAVFDRILGKDHADAPVPQTPSDDIAKTGTTPAGTHADVGFGEESHTRLRSPSPITSEPPQGGGSTEGAQDTTSGPHRGGTHPAPHSDATDDSHHSDNEPHKDPDHESDDEPDRESDDEPDHESDDEPDRESDHESDDGDERGQADDTEENDGSSDGADVDGSTNSNDDAEEVDAETEETSSN